MPSFVVTIPYSEKEIGKTAKQHSIDLTLEAPDAMAAVELAMERFRQTTDNPHASWLVQVESQGINVRDQMTGHMFRISDTKTASKQKDEEKKLLSMEDYLRQFETDPLDRLNLYREALELSAQRLEWNDFSEKLLALTCRAVQAEAGAILWVDTEKSELRFEVAQGPAADTVRKLRVPLWKGIAGHVARHGESLALSDVKRDPRFFREIAEQTGYETRSILAAPISFQGKNLGVLEALNKTSSDVFHGNDLETARHLSSLAGLSFKARHAS